MILLDEFDRAILTELQKDAMLSFAELGERVHLSASAVLRRVQRLKADGVIAATRAILDPRKVGLPLTMLIHLALGNDHADLRDAVKASFRDAPEVQQCYYVTGDADLIVVVAMPDMEAYEQFTRRMILGNPNIQHFKTSVVMDCVKSTSILPI
jgi:Lrp/AsnC family transcriptional regulator, leucine-responsive regulatory protein